MVSNSNIPSSVLKYSFWNIRGYTSKIIGNKLIHNDFIEKIKDCDVVGLAETHIHEEILNKLSIPGFIRIHYLIRKANSKSKGSGGVAVFCKPHISKYVTPVKNNNQDAAWVKIDKSLCGRDTYLGTLYFSPTGTKEHISKQFSDLASDIAKFQQKGEVIIQGDLNARIGKEQDFFNLHNVECHKDYDEEEESGIGQRNSEDIVINKRGEELVELCKSLNMVILNGRKVGDP